MDDCNTNHDPLSAFFAGLLQNNTPILVADNHRSHETDIVLPIIDRQQAHLRWESDPSLSFNETNLKDETRSRWKSVPDHRRRTYLTKPRRTNSNENDRPGVSEESVKISTSRHDCRTRKHKEFELSICLPQMPVRKGSITPDASETITDKYHTDNKVACE